MEGEEWVEEGKEACRCGYLRCAQEKPKTDTNRVFTSSFFASDAFLSISAKTSLTASLVSGSRLRLRPINRPQALR